MSFPSWSKGSVCLGPRGHALQSQKLPVKLCELKGSGRGENKRAERQRRGGKKGQRVAHIWQHHSQTDGENTQKEEAKESSATEPVWDHDNDAKWLKQRYLFSQPICHIVFQSLGRKLPMRYLFKMLSSWRERGLLSWQEVKRQQLFRSSALSSEADATF